MASTASRSQRQLIVEGPDDEHVVIHVMRKMRPTWDQEPRNWGGFEVKSAGGDTQAIKDFGIAAKAEAGSIGLMLDADDQSGKHVADRWNQVRTTLTQLVQPFPDAIPTEGWIGNTTLGLRVGVWIMPNNQVDGGLEAFLTPFVPAADDSWVFAQTVIEQAKKTYNVPYPAHYAPKARLHTWLAWRKEAGRPYGRAIKCGDLIPNGAVVTQFADWFERLFITDQRGLA
ncbi:MAG: hypothetical protein FWD73_04800 [Polyangiaceae bacterium]|nr:hypothetical protein [Polyangiaceae bacterium]